MAFSPDGKLVASASRDKTVRISQVSDGSLVREIKVRDPAWDCFCFVVLYCVVLCCVYRSVMIWTSYL